MSVMWFLLGALVVLFGLSLNRWVTKNQLALSWLSWLGVIVGSVLFFFALAWCFTSIVEGERQAAVMGLVFFGIPSLVILGLARGKGRKGTQVKA